MRKAIAKITCFALALAVAAAACALQNDRARDRRREDSVRAAEQRPAPNADDETEYGVPARLLRRVEPKYTAAAREAKIEGAVKCRLIVGADGLAHNIEVTEGLDAGLDASAVEAVRQWKFEPAQKQGKPVPSRANLVLIFRLK